jgi:hypothetical protein
MLLSLAVMVAVNRRLTPRDAVLVLATAALAMQSVRHVALFIAAATPLWIQQAEIIRTRLSGWRTGRGRRGRRWTSPPARLMLLTSLPVLMLLGLLGATRLAAAAATREDSAYYAKTFPVCAVRWLDTAPAGLRIFNQYGEGGYVASRLAERGDRVFIFGDAALMGDRLVLAAGSVESVAPGWEQTLHDSRTDIVLYDRGTALEHALLASPRWMLVYRDSLSDAFVPATAAGRELATRLPAQPVVASSSPCSPDHPSAEAKAG